MARLGFFSISDKQTQSNRSRDWLIFVRAKCEMVDFVTVKYDLFYFFN